MHRGVGVLSGVMGKVHPLGAHHHHQDQLAVRDARLGTCMAVPAAATILAAQDARLGTCMAVTATAAHHLGPLGAHRLAVQDAPLGTYGAVIATLHPHPHPHPHRLAVRDARPVICGAVIATVLRPTVKANATLDVQLASYMVVIAIHHRQVPRVVQAARQDTSTAATAPAPRHRATAKLAVPLATCGDAHVRLLTRAVLAASQGTSGAATARI